jgi:two-component system NarL family sensor kinase
MATMSLVSSASVSAGRRSRAVRALIANPITQFTLAGLGAVLVVGAVAALLLENTGNEEAISTAKQVSSLAGEGIVEPLVTDGLAAGDSSAMRPIDDVVRNRILGRDGVVRVKIWNRRSEIVYSDEPRLIGDRFELGAEERDVLFHGGTEAERSDLSRPENRFENSDTDLVEVYLPIHTPSGQPLLFETYLRSSFIDSQGNRIISTLAPVLIGALLVLFALQLPLAISLARRLRRGVVEREELLTRAITASEIERRRIAQDLHDGVVQDLAGVSYSVAAAAGRAGAGEAASAESLDDAAARLRQSLRDLRGLLVEIYPPDLHRVGIKGALSDIVAGLNSRGLEATLDVPDDLGLSAEQETLFFRISQEALRNVVAHAGASRVSVRIGEDPGIAWLEVTDDGRGFDSTKAGQRGHFGLRMLGDYAREANGNLRIDSRPGEGARLRVEVPA